jgi:hypothetical protein
VVVIKKKRGEPIVDEIWLVMSQERDYNQEGIYPLLYECTCETEAEAIAAAPDFGVQCYVLPVKRIFTLPDRALGIRC